MFCFIDCLVSNVLNLKKMNFQTFKPKKGFERGTLKFNLHKQANASLNSGIDLKEVVKLPPGEDVNDWIAVHGIYALSLYSFFLSKHSRYIQYILGKTLMKLVLIN